MSVFRSLAVASLASALLGCGALLGINQLPGDEPDASIGNLTEGGEHDEISVDSSESSTKRAEDGAADSTTEAGDANVNDATAVEGSDVVASDVASEAQVPDDGRAGDGGPAEADSSDGDGGPGVADGSGDADADVADGSEDARPIAAEGGPNVAEGGSDSGLDGAEGGSGLDAGQDTVTCPTTGLTCDGGCVSSATDSNKCGRCGHSCVGGVCAGGQCPPVPLASQAPYASAIAVDSTNVYWTESTDASQADASGAVKKALLSGANFLAPTPLVGSQAYPTGIGVNSTGLYWINTGTSSASGGVMWLPVGATAPTKLATSFPSPVAMALTATDLYWVDSSSTPNDKNEVLLTLPSGNPTVAPNELVTTGMNCVQALAVASGYAEWLQSGCFAFDGAMERALLSPLGANPTNLLPSSTLSGPYSARIARRHHGCILR